MKNTDTRVQFTKAKLKEALMEILKKKAIGQVGVAELCAKAGINRGTFYLHYSVPNDVLKEIEGDFIKANLPYFNPYLSGPHDVALLPKIFETMLTNKEQCLILMGPNGSPKFAERIKNLVKEDVIDSWQKDNQSVSRENIEATYEFVFVGSTATILEWMRGESNISIEKLGKMLDGLGHYCQMAMKEF